MLGLYLFALGLGGVLLAMSLFGGGHGDDMGDVSHDVGHHGHDSAWHQFFSIRNATYFLFVFGAAGTLLSWFGGGGAGTAILASGVGLAVAALVHVVFGYLRRTDTSEMESDAELVGRDAQVTLSIRPDSLGKVELTVGGRRVELLARPFERDAAAAGEIRTGAEVVIVEMVAGTALVSPVAEN